jgi:OHCU decarboxylase
LTLMTLTLTQVNAHDRRHFVEALGWIFEGSPWVAERAWEMRPFATVDGLHGAMASVVSSAPKSEQLTLLCAHPDLGARAAMSDASTREQEGAGLDTLTASEMARLQALNGAYRARFGFPFLYAVRGSTKRDILDALERRVTSPREEEREEALRQVFRIARFRLEETIGERQ